MPCSTVVYAQGRTGNTAKDWLSSANAVELTYVFQLAVAGIEAPHLMFYIEDIDYFEYFYNY